MENSTDKLSVQISEYKHVLEMLEENKVGGGLTFNYALKKTIRLTENFSKEDTGNERVKTFALKAAMHLSDYKWIDFGNSTAAKLELFLHAMSSVLYILSQCIDMVVSDARASLYKSVSTFWAVYRKTKCINANIMFDLREIRTSLKKIKDDKSAIDHATNILGIVINAAQKEYFAAFSAFIGILDFEYSAGEWHFKWINRCEQYSALRRTYPMNSDSEIKEIRRFYRKLYRSSTREYERVKMKDTKYRNFEYKMLQSGGIVTKSSPPDHIDTLLIGYLDLIQRLLEEFFTSIKNYVAQIVSFCNEIIKTHVKKKLTFKAAEILYVIKESDVNKEIKNEIDLNFENYFSITFKTLSPQPLSPFDFQKARQQQLFKKTIDNVVELFAERRKIKDDIKEVEREFDKLLNDKLKNGATDEDFSIMSKLEEVFKNRGKEEATKLFEPINLHLEGEKDGIISGFEMTRDVPSETDRDNLAEWVVIPSEKKVIVNDEQHGPISSTDDEVKINVNNNPQKKEIYDVSPKINEEEPSELNNSPHLEREKEGGKREEIRVLPPGINEEAEEVKTEIDNPEIKKIEELPVKSPEENLPEKIDGCKGSDDSESVYSDNNRKSSSSEEEYTLGLSERPVINITINVHGSDDNIQQPQQIDRRDSSFLETIKEYCDVILDGIQKGHEAAKLSLSRRASRESLNVINKEEEEFGSEMTEINEKEKEFEVGMIEINEKEKEFEVGMIEINEKEKEFEAGMVEINEKEKEFEARMIPTN